MSFLCQTQRSTPRSSTAFVAGTSNASFWWTVLQLFSASWACPASWPWPAQSPQPTCPPSSQQAQEHSSRALRSSSPAARRPRCQMRTWRCRRRSLRAENGGLPITCQISLLALPASFVRDEPVEWRNFPDLSPAAADARTRCERPADGAVALSGRHEATASICLRFTHFREAIMEKMKVDTVVAREFLFLE